MKRAPIKDLRELNHLRQQLQARAEQTQLIKQQCQQEKLAAQQEANIFHHHVGDVTPIKKPDTHIHQRSLLSTKIIRKGSDEITSMSQAMRVIEQWSDEFDANLWQIDDENQAQGLSYAIKGSSPDLLSRLRKGQWPAQAYLDLHGMQRDQARSALADFLRRSTHAKLRSVCVIHGKGNNSHQSAVLPSKVRIWLCQSELVQAFCPANPRDGGDGALHVLLRS